MTYKLKIACAKKYLKDIRDFVINVLHTLHLPDNEIDMMVLAIDEVCSNLIIHSNHCDENQYIELNIKDSKGQILFEIYDKGRAFDHSQYEEPNLAKIIKEKRKGGLGLMLVRRIMDSIEFEQEDSYNVYRLAKNLSAC